MTQSSPKSPGSSPPASSPPRQAATPPLVPPPAPDDLVTNAEAPLEADETTATDDGRSIDDRISTYTDSLASSVVDYPTDHGRRYHAFRRGAYMMPNDNKEINRLDIAHALVTRATGDKLYLAPIEEDKTHRILDVGTGTGVWAVDMGDLFPNAEIIGNDLSAIQPSWVPANVKFEIDDVESEWVGTEKYDYIFVRHMLISISDWPRLMKNIFDNLNPGGWVEFQDLDGLYYSDDGSYKETHETWKWNKELIDTCESIGRTSRPGPQLRGWVEEAGFENITHQRFKCPLGPWAKDPFYKDIGMLNLVQLLEGLEAFSLKVFCDVLGWTKEATMVMLASVRNELKENAFNGIFDHHVVYAQKPFTSEETEE
ncbi:Secondary metabolism regulator LAE1 [Colletotrichum trifolii]|uniref:Secondary metabolism regulator LAE1 n=1 Tax=Colletotrichum trifolii TaxID=5466 RepID=A0A4R8QZ12_COLTR|nr:Secondary metabolism regulator LAE1 [Colletotrichum trifolii]